MSSELNPALNAWKRGKSSDSQLELLHSLTTLLTTLCRVLIPLMTTSYPKIPESSNALASILRVSFLDLMLATFRDISGVRSSKVVIFEGDVSQCCENIDLILQMSLLKFTRSELGSILSMHVLIIALLSTLSSDEIWRSSIEMLLRIHLRQQLNFTPIDEWNSHQDEEDAARRLFDKFLMTSKDAQIDGDKEVDFELNNVELNRMTRDNNRHETIVKSTSQDALETLGRFLFQGDKDTAIFNSLRELLNISTSVDAAVAIVRIFHVRLLLNE